MKIKQYEHQCSYTQTKKSERRMCWALLDDNGNFIDSFDYDTVNNMIRFYGGDKHYKPDNIPVRKQMIWKTNNLFKIMFVEREYK